MPLSPPMSPLRLKQWVEAAQPNARMVYGEGAGLAEACPADVKQAVMDLAERGWLTPHFQRNRGGAPQYIVQRTHRPFLKGSKF